MLDRRRSVAIALLVVGLAVAAPPACAAARPALTEAQGPAREETLPLLDASATAGWQPEESTLTAASLGGIPALDFHVKVDWLTGEPNYPIGWPRAARNLPAELKDWRGWEQIRYRVYATSDRGTLPPSALSLVIGTGNRNISWETSADGLRPGVWREYIYDLTEIPYRDQVRMVEFAIAESEYHDGESLDFWISKLELVRYTRPTLVDLALESRVAFADQRAVPFTVKVLGVAAGGTAPVQVSLQRAGKSVAAQQLKAGEGVTPLGFSLSHPLSPGQYRFVARVGDQALTADLTLVPSPWQEVKR
jgi:hypothetical protein